jgi:hypothetical protein
MSNPGIAGITTQAAAGAGSRLQQVSAFIASLAGTAVQTFGAVQALRQSPASGQAFLSQQAQTQQTAAKSNGINLQTVLLVGAVAALAVGAVLAFRKK